MRICLLYLILASLNVTAGAQVKQQAILVDEYSYSPACDDFLGRLDGFLGELRDHPGWNGVIVLRNARSLRHRTAMLQATIESWLDFREFDKRRVEFIRADSDEHSREFWRIASGAQKPPVKHIVPDFGMSDVITRPFLLTEERPTHICPEIDNLKIFAGFMKDNPMARGNVVVRGDSPSIARRKAARIVLRLQANYGVSSKRIRTYTSNFDRPSNYERVLVEYWYLP